MRIAYIISAYKYPEQLARLIFRLKTDTVTFFVHVDKKAGGAVYRQIVDRTGQLPNLRFLKRHVCYWGGFGHVRATLEGIGELHNAGIPFDYAILLTGQDYPIQSNEKIEACLREAEGRSFMAYFPLPAAEWENAGLDRIEHWHFRSLNRHFRFPPHRRFPIKRRFPRGFKPFGGASYWCLSRECVEYIHAFTQGNRAFVNFFRFVDVPDEIFFQTILMNSPLRETIVNDDLRYTDWRDPDSGSPAILRAGDFEAIARSAKLFARKFDMSVDARVLELIDRDLLGVR